MGHVTGGPDALLYLLVPRSCCCLERRPQHRFFLLTLSILLFVPLNKQQTICQQDLTGMQVLFVRPKCVQW